MRKGIRTRTRNGDAGFTLIELLVVVLILGILMAIAIPTFLSLTSGAKSGSAEADLTTAVQDEATYESLYGDFDGVTPPGSTALLAAADNVIGTSPPGMTLTDPGINWTATLSVFAAAKAGTKTVYVSENLATTAIVLGAAGQDGKFYWLSDNVGVLNYGYSTASTVPTSSPATWATSWKAATAVT